MDERFFLTEIKVFIRIYGLFVVVKLQVALGVLVFALSAKGNRMKMNNTRGSSTFSNQLYSQLFLPQMPKKLIISIIDFFYPPFRKIMPLQTFRYAACGGGNTLLGLVIYSITYKYILQERDLDLGFYAFKPHIAALFFSFSINFPLGFILMKYVVFNESNIRARIQLFRYFIFFIFCLFLNYVLLKLLVEILGWYAIVAQIITTVIVVCVSYLTQKHFTFKVERKEQDFPF